MREFMFGISVEVENWKLIEEEVMGERKVEVHTKDNYTCYLIPIDHVEMEDDDSEDENESIIKGIELEVEEELQESKRFKNIKKFLKKWWNMQ